MSMRIPAHTRMAAHTRRGFCTLVLFISDSLYFAADYVTTSKILNFTAGQHSKCVSLSIMDDTIAEREESFYVTLERTPDLDDRIILDPAAVRGLVEIVDDDGECFK